MRRRDFLKALAGGTISAFLGAQSARMGNYGQVLAQALEDREREVQKTVIDWLMYGEAAMEVSDDGLTISHVSIVEHPPNPDSRIIRMVNDDVWTDKAPEYQRTMQHIREHVWNIFKPELGDEPA